MLYGRETETAALRSLLEAARASTGRALVVRGEAGIGKSALLTATAETADADSGQHWTVLRCTGVESEHTWSFAGLQALLLPLTGHLESIPEHHACLLSRVLGLAAAPDKPAPPENFRFIVGMAALSLLSQAAAERPVLCVVDDAHWLDPDSADVLLFAAKRLGAEPIAMVFGVREGYAPDFPTPGLEDLVVGPLDEEAATRLLAERASALTYASRGRILQAAEGNPLALLELPSVEAETRLAADWTGQRRSTTTRLKQVFGDRIDRLPQNTRNLLLLIAADETADTALILKAAAGLGADLSDLAPAETDDLVRYRGGAFEFGHPLIRTASYQGAPSFRRVEAHQAFAAALDPEDHRRPFHLAAATTGPDESVVAALETAGTCLADCGGHSVEYAVFERAASFTPDGPDKGRRLLLAAQAALSAGNAPKAHDLAGQVARYSDDRLTLAYATIVSASVASWGGDMRAAYRLWLDAADHFTAAKPEAAGYPLFRAVELSWHSGDFARAETAAEHAERLGIEHASWVRDLAAATAGLNRSCAVTPADAIAALRRLIDIHQGFGDGVSLHDRTMVAWWRVLIGDIAGAERDLIEIVRTIRSVGAVESLPRALTINGTAEFHKGRWADAEALAENALDVSVEVGQRIGLVKTRVHVLAPIAALRGDEVGTRELIDQAVAAAPADTNVAIGAPLALLDLTLGRNEEALDRYLTVLDSEAPGDALIAVPDAVEAAVRTESTGRVADIFDWFATWAEATELPHWRALVERCRGLLAADAEAGAHYERAADLHRESGDFPFETARTDLILGEWLRRARRVNEAKSRLRSAASTFERLGAAPWAERVKRELRAAGDAGPVEAAPALAEKLTPQELQVVRLAAAGLSNREIGEQLYLSPRTAGYHLYKAYPKLGVAARGELVKLGL
ncbi:helix-turn-helix transcriptional regulator [Glycomyces buryatensis]|uniref:helix-turn-helix transcriptional regulator n=1 Tax=Glycomyces buryatensis TaxID=2570927 RepID=UPI00145629C5|nr:helix-turn-helix transcriptional regulator [Glycomyces buryatensis]